MKAIQIDQTLRAMVCARQVESEDSERIAPDSVVALTTGRPSWFYDSAVVENIVRIGDEFRIYLVFAHPQEPTLLIRRFEASTSAKYVFELALLLRRRATHAGNAALTLNLNAFDVNPN